MCKLTELHGLLLLLILVSGCSSPSDDPGTQQPAAQPPSVSSGETPTAESLGCIDDWIGVADGMRYRQAGCNSGKSSAGIHLVEVDPARVQLRAVVSKNSTASSVARNQRALLALNTNFFDDKRDPLGLVVRDGRVVNPLHPVSWQSVFLVRKDRTVAMVPPSEWIAEKSRAVTAVQCGPRLVTAGKRNQVKKAEPSQRSGVCVTSSGKVIFFVSGSGEYRNVHEIAELAHSAVAGGGMGCEDAMLFDGGPSAQLFLDTPDKKILIDGDQVPAFITASPFPTSR